MRSTLIFLVLLVHDYPRESSFYEFECRNHDIKIELPNFSYTEKISGYGEGRFILLDFGDAGVVVAHCGGAVVRPFLKSRKHKLLSCQEVDGHIVRKGVHRDNRLYWQEDFYKGLDITVYFANVSSSNLEEFERALSTIQSTERGK